MPATAEYVACRSSEADSRPANISGVCGAEVAPDGSVVQDSSGNAAGVPKLALECDLTWESRPRSMLTIEVE